MRPEEIMSGRTWAHIKQHPELTETPKVHVSYRAQFHVRIREVRREGAKIEEHKLAFHVVTILLSIGLTIIGTLAVFALWHIGLVLPTFPNLIQEVWDWLFKQ